MGPILLLVQRPPVACAIVWEQVLLSPMGSPWDMGGAGAPADLSTPVINTEIE